MYNIFDAMYNLFCIWNDLQSIPKIQEDFGKKSSVKF